MDTKEGVVLCFHVLMGRLTGKSLDVYFQNSLFHFHASLPLSIQSKLNPNSLFFFPFMSLLV